MKSVIKYILNEYLSESTVIDITKNRDAAPNMGSKFGQDIEPKGTYVLKGKSGTIGWINGKAQLKNPLFINVTQDTLIQYKQELANKYKAKGAALTKKLMNMGYDAIVTVLPDGEYGEIVLFPNASFMMNESDDDYRMDHTAPNKKSGAPVHDVTMYYPDDLFGPQGVRYYGHGVPYDGLAINILRQAKGKPDHPIKIYRTVPSTLSNVDKIKLYQKHKEYMSKTGKLPKGVDNWPNVEEYDNYLTDEIEELSNLPDDSKTKYNINAGDWVSTTLQYAKSHGDSHLGKYKVLSKVVPAKHVFSSGDSIHEYGYDPS